MDPLQVALVSAVVAAVAAEATFLLVRRLSPARGGAVAAGLALALGYVAGHLAGTGLPRIPPREAWQWLPALALAGAAVAVAESCATRLPSAARWGLRLALGLFAAWTALPKRTALDVAWLGAAVLAWTWLLDRSTRRASAASATLAVAVVAVATSVSLAVSGSMLLGQLGAALAAASAACLLHAWRAQAPFATAVPAAAVLLAGAWMNGVLYSELPLASALCLAAAPALGWLADLVVAARLPRGRALAVRTAAAALAAGAAVAFAVAASPPLGY